MGSSHKEERKMPPRKQRRDMTPEEVRAMQLSKKLSKVLRHDAHKLRLDIDKAAFVSLEALLRLPLFKGYSEEEVRAVVSSNDKQRFAIVDGRIRANQGHTFPVDDAELL